jgi:branched-subunit amino acid ABC-type transport system permease component
MNLLPFIGTGLGLGAIYGMAGVGLVILFRASGTINFALGAIGALAAHVTWQLVQWGVPGPVAWPSGVAVAVIASVGYGRLISARLVDREATVRSVATLGFALLLMGICISIWGPGLPRRLMLPTDHTQLTFGGVRITLTRLIALAFAVVSAVIMGIVLRRTRIGLSMRAMASSRPTATVIGVPVLATDTAAWAISGLFAGLTGLLLSVLIVMSPIPLTFLVIPALATAVVGQMVSLPLTLVGGLICGLGEAMLTGVPGLTVYRSAFPYVVALMVISVFAYRLPGAAR